MNPLSSVAYIKATETSDSADAIEVSEEDFPAFRDLGNGLSVFYLVDEGGYFAYVQRKDLSAALIIPSSS